MSANYVYVARVQPASPSSVAFGTWHFGQSVSLHTYEHLTHLTIEGGQLMPTLIFTYSPKPDVSFEEFKRFLEEVDQPVTLSLPSTTSSRILRVTDENAPFACIEILEITSFEEWEQDAKRPEVQEVVARWPEYGAVDELKVYNCEEFYAG